MHDVKLITLSGPLMAASVDPQRATGIGRIGPGKKLLQVAEAVAVWIGIRIDAGVTEEQQLAAAGPYFHTPNVTARQSNTLKTPVPPDRIVQYDAGAKVVTGRLRTYFAI